MWKTNTTAQSTSELSPKHQKWQHCLQPAQATSKWKPEAERYASEKIGYCFFYYRILSFSKKVISVSKMIMEPKWIPARVCILSRRRSRNQCF